MGILCCWHQWHDACALEIESWWMRAWGLSCSSSRRNFVCDSSWRGVNPSSVRPKHPARWPTKTGPLCSRVGAMVSSEFHGAVCQALGNLTGQGFALTYIPAVGMAVSWLIFFSKSLSCKWALLAHYHYLHLLSVESYEIVFKLAFWTKFRWRSLISSPPSLARTAVAYRATHPTFAQKKLTVETTAIVFRCHFDSKITRK